jgi:PH (Pleckstrin Homology) domain-containing protein
MNTFKSSLDQPSYVITILVAAIGLYLLYRGYSGGSAGGRLGFLVVAALVLLMYLLRTRSIAVDGTGITIDRMVMSASIPFSDIKTIRRLEDKELFGSIRTLGNGGVFGYTGLFYNRTFGSMTWYCTQRKNYILIEKNSGKKMIISPDNPEELIQLIRLTHPSLA